ncbi:hypothetical protein [Actinacidiphila yeochonensis]|uniref:hypothetical protein n=1 Tax=Actinacidiphila yeochonensis TaxID=89050 RepID=UPI000B07798A|nr:hypothetical protein [Actinacidiphila yeochonensis]
MRVRRTFAVLSTVVPLVLAAAACSDSSAGQVIGTRGVAFVQRIDNPNQAAGACHRFKGVGVDRVANNTAVDIWLHKGPNCNDPNGQPSVYLATTLTANTKDTRGLWRSFTTQGWPPPVPPNVHSTVN